MNVQRKTVNFHPVLTCETREALDRLSRQQGVSRSEIIRRAVNLLESVQRPQATQERKQA